MGIVRTNKGDFIFQSVDDAIEIVQTVAQEKGDLWVSGDDYNDKNQNEVTFIADGVGWCPAADAVISLNDVFLCIREFLYTYERPSCIQWQEL